MQHARFIFVAVATPQGDTDAGRRGVSWMLLSPNNRRLGCGASVHPAYAACRDAVVTLRFGHDRFTAQSLTLASNGQWIWQVDLDGVAVAVSCRSYLRARECTYNLERFLEAVPTAEIVEGTKGTPRDRLGRGFGPEAIGQKQLLGPRVARAHIVSSGPDRLGASQ